MIKIDMEFKKGLLFIRLTGDLNKISNSEFRNTVFPIVLKNEFKYVVLNLLNLNTIDDLGIESLIDLNHIVETWKGKTSICNLNNEELKKKIYNSALSNCYYQTNNELTAVGVFKI